MSALGDQLAERIALATDAKAGPLLVGLCGAQGSGKSTVSEAIVARLGQLGLTCALISIDDLYCTRAEREALAATVHPLLLTRGVPGTHDVALGLDTIAALARDGIVALPRFDKGGDDRAPHVRWPAVQAPVDVILLEGWCVGAVPQPDAALVDPVNALERDEDSDGAWRNFVNGQLAGDYRGLFDPIDLLILLAAPRFDVVRGWRGEQEARLRDAGGGARVMTDDDVARFIAHYERLTRWVLEEMPARADVVVRLDAERRVVDARGL